MSFPTQFRRILFNKNVIVIIAVSEKKMPETYGNRYVSVNEQNGWNLENFTGNELSFSQKSYIIAADSDSRLINSGK